MDIHKKVIIGSHEQSPNVGIAIGVTFVVRVAIAKETYDGGGPALITTVADSFALMSTLFSRRQE